MKLEIIKKIKKIPGVIALYRVLNSFNFINFIRLFNFFKDFMAFRGLQGMSKDQRFSLFLSDIYPCLNDKTGVFYIDKHYVCHVAWAARVLKKIFPKEHVDISSLVYFNVIVSAFIPVKFYDYRPLSIEMDNLYSGKADLSELPFGDNSIESLSCMHVVEHIGLGRYGDKMDFNGDVKAIKELKRVTAINGYLLFVVPVGNKSKIMFNAHRIYRYEQVLSYFDDCFVLVEFALIPDDKSVNVCYLINPSMEEINDCDYGCGCFLFKKQPV